MNILEKLGFKGPRKDKPVKNESLAVKSAVKQNTSNPHDNGGCCGGCGGTQEKES